MCVCAAHGHQLLSRFPISFHLLSFSSYILFILKINDFLSPILGNSWYQKLIFAHRNECIINMVNLNWMTNKGLLNLSSRLYNYSPFARFSVSLCNIFYCIRVFFCEILQLIRENEKNECKHIHRHELGLCFVSVISRNHTKDL